ncbi:MAG: prolyl oligopeptidase family serine peptidase [Bacteroidales bacterium]|jgi:predicted peptidase|nr:prolyl oligopeptidase family serine peptidase [Bacteroidales bacterium]
MNVSIKRAAIIIACISVLPLILSVKSWKPDYSLFEKKEYVKGEYTLPYRILWPEDMEEGKSYPLFIFLHGKGLSGNDNERQLKRGAELFLEPENRKKYPSIVIYPQAPKRSAFVNIMRNGKSAFFVGTRKLMREESNRNEMEISLSPYGEMVYDIINQLIVGNIIDTTRIYIGGVSMGGYTTYQMIAEYPDLFAAAVAMSAGASLSNVEKWAGKVPIWIIHGEKDPMVPVENSRLIVKELEKLGITNFRYSEYEGIKHHSWEVAFEDPGFLEWVYTKSRK